MKRSRLLRDLCLHSAVPQLECADESSPFSAPVASRRKYISVSALQHQQANLCVMYAWLVMNKQDDKLHFFVYLFI